MAQKVTSTDIKLALKEFHNGKPSYFITECKTCSTYFPDPQGLLKFDGLAITKSYTKQEAFDIQHEKLKEQYRSGAIDWKKYNSLFKKLQKEVNEEADNKRRALFGGGVSGLQDIYDAVSKGTFRDTGQVTYGHGSAYYTDRRRTNPNCSESLANYASLCVGHPELIDILAEDYPEIVTALRGCVEAMLKEVPK